MSRTWKPPRGDMIRIWKRPCPLFMRTRVISETMSIVARVSPDFDHPRPLDDRMVKALLAAVRPWHFDHQFRSPKPKRYTTTLRARLVSPNLYTCLSARMFTSAVTSTSPSATVPPSYLPFSLCRFYVIRLHHLPEEFDDGHLLVFLRDGQGRDAVRPLGSGRRRGGR